ncbi:MAG TPA: phosphoribosyltransferase family protein [Candidatus Paceibacterota bacterium]|nr:phosphoribosyltransferase family protein [Candidatus Paceibacterota bacterium]
MLHRHKTDPKLPLSPICLNLSTRDSPNPGPLTGILVDWAGRCMRGMLDSEYVGFDAVVGANAAGEPFADVISRISGVPRLVYLAGERTLPCALNGSMPQTGSRVLIVDDVITAGNSKWATVDALRRAGFEVTDIVVLIDREYGGVESLHERGIHVHAVYRLSEMITWYYAKGAISKEMYDAIAEYFQLPVCI